MPHIQRKTETTYLPRIENAVAKGNHCRKLSPSTRRMQIINPPRYPCPRTRLLAFTINSPYIRSYLLDVPDWVESNGISQRSASPSQLAFAGTLLHLHRCKIGNPVPFLFARGVAPLGHLRGGGSTDGGVGLVQNSTRSRTPVVRAPGAACSLRADGQGPRRGCTEYVAVKNERARRSWRRSASFYNHRS